MTLDLCLTEQSKILYLLFIFCTLGFRKYMKLPGAGGSIYLTTYIMGWIIYTTWKSIVAESESCKNIVPIFTISFLDWTQSRADRWWRHLLVENFVTWFSVKPFRFWPRIKKILENCQKEFFSQPIWSGWTKIHFSVAYLTTVAIL